MESIKASYSINSRAEEIRARAEALALEQSVEMPASAIREQRIKDEIVARVETITESAPNEYRVTLGLATATTGLETGQLMNMLFGNCSLQEDIRLVDVELPQPLLAAFPGPRFGIAGIRERLAVHGRALTATALKPQGLAPAELAQLCGTFALGGIDVIKDDHGLADQTYAPFAARVRACQRAVAMANAETGRKSVYAPSLSGSPRRLAEQVRIAQDEGVGMVLAAPMIMGLPCFQALVQEELKVPVMAHPALAGAARISPALFFGKLFRLFGADAVIFPNYGGRFSYGKSLCASLATTARSELGACKPVLPVPAGGMSVERVPEMLAMYGIDTMLLIGGGLLSAGDALLARSREFVEMVAQGGARAACRFL